MKTRGKRKYEKGYEFKKLTLLRHARFDNVIKYCKCTSRSVRLFGHTIDGSELTNEMESIGNYQSVARSTYLHQGFVRITNNGGGYVGIGAGTECNVTCGTVKLNVYLERSSGSEDFYSYKKWENVDYNTSSLYLNQQVKVEKGYYYRLRGYHSCTKNGVLENGASRTDGIYIG